MEQIDTSFIQKYYKYRIKNKNKLTIYKNIFYIKLLGYFEDIDFLQWINIDKQANKFEWYFLVLIVLGISKCSDQFINKFINEYYITFPLKQRLVLIANFNYSLLGVNIYRIIKLISKLSFYEQKHFIKIRLDRDFTPTQLIIYKLTTIDEIVKYMNEKDSLSCALNLYNSKYIDKNIFLKIANKTFVSNKSYVCKIKTWLQLIDISLEIDYQLNLLVFILLNCDTLYPFKILIKKMPSNSLDMIMLNKTLCEKFIRSLLEFYDINRSKSIIKIMGKKINPTIEQKNIIINCLIKILNKFSAEDLFVYLIKIFKLVPQDVDIILKNLSNLSILSILSISKLTKSYLIHLKDCLIDKNEYFYPELRIELFKRFIKFKLVNENEIRHFILDNVLYLKYYQIKKYIKNFKQDYFEALVTNTNTNTNTIILNSLWILHFKFNVTNFELVEKTFSILKSDEQDWVIYDLINSLIKKFNLEKIQNVFLQILEQFNYKKCLLSWLFTDILRLCLIDNKIEKITKEKKDMLNKFLNFYKNLNIIKEIKKLYLL